MENSSLPTLKRFMYINRRAPHGSNYAQESLELVMITAAFEQHVCMVFMDDGVYQLKSGQDTSVLALKNFSKTLRALEDFDVEDIYVEEQSLTSRGISVDDLVVPVKVLSSLDLGKLMAQQDVIINS